MTEKRRTGKPPQGKTIAQDLLAKRGIDKRDYIKQLSTLKKQGVVSKVIDPKTHKPTRYMLGRIKKFKDVAAGHAHAVSAKDVAPDIREKYTERGVIEERGGYFVIPKTQAKQRAGIAKGHVALFEPLKNGETRVIFLPYRAADMNELVSVLRDNESAINAMKGSTEQFGFQLYGNNSRDGFPHASDLATYIIDNYQHILNSSRWNKDAMNGLNFVLLRFKNRKGSPQEGPYMGERISHKTKRNRRKESEYEQGVKRKYSRGRKAKYREKKETEEQREKRLEWQRNYTKRNRKKKDKPAPEF